jgi:phosphoglycerate dehydrogenase-like enzyme
MNPKPLVLLLAWLPDGWEERLAREFPEFDFVNGREEGVRDRHLGRCTITYGLPPVPRLAEAGCLGWIQLISAGVPQDLCPAARQRGITVTNLAGLYGASIAEHALAMMLILSRNLHVVLRNQDRRVWDRTVARTMTDLHGKTLAVVGAGNIGRGIARLGQAHGMRVLGCRRRPQPTPFLDQVYSPAEVCTMLAEADYVAVAAPLTRQTEGMLGEAEFAAMKKGVIYINVSRGSIAQEQALRAALEAGHVAAAGLDVFAVEPLAPDHPFWSMPQVLVSPHYSGETINQSSLPVERFCRNLRNRLANRELEGVVDLDHGY